MRPKLGVRTWGWIHDAGPTRRSDLYVGTTVANRDNGAASSEKVCCEIQHEGREEVGAPSYVYSTIP